MVTINTIKTTQMITQLRLQIHIHFLISAALCMS